MISPEADRRAAEAANGELYAAVEAGDPVRMQALWDGEDDPAVAEQVTCVHPGWLPVHGRGRVLRSWTVIMANTPYVQIFVTDVRTRVHGDVAVVSCQENILTSLEDPAGESRVAATNVFRRHGEGWRLLVHHGSLVLPPSEGEPT